MNKKRVERPLLLKLKWNERYLAFSQLRFLPSSVYIPLSYLNQSSLFFNSDFFSPLLWFGINYANVCFFLRFIQLGTVSFSFAPFEYPLKYLQFRVSSIQTIVVHLSVPNDLTISPFVGVVFSLLLLVSFLGFCVQCIFISIRSFDIRHKTQNLHTIYLYIYVYFRDSSMCTHK